MGGEIKLVSGSLSQPCWTLQSRSVKRKANKGIRGLSVCSCVRPKLIQVLHPCPQPQGCVLKGIRDDKKQWLKSPETANHRDHWGCGFRRD